MTKKTQSKKVKEIEESHSRSSLVNIVSNASNGWDVQTNENAKAHTVKKIEDPICKNKCPLKCTKCNICVHEYVCSCHDNFVHFNICKHIHACAKLSTPQNYAENTINDDLQKKQLDKEILEIACLASSSKNSQLTTEAVKNDLMSKWNIIKGILEEKDFDS